MTVRRAALTSGQSVPLLSPPDELDLPLWRYGVEFVIFFVTVNRVEAAGWVLDSMGQ